MAAPTKVSDQDVRDALARWRGSVVDAARTLTISDNALRKRMKTLGIGPQALSFLRRHNLPHQPTPTMRPQPNQAQPTSDNLQPKSDRPNFPKPAETPSLGRSMSSMSPEAVVKKPKVVKLLPEQVDQLWDTKLDFNAKYRMDATEETLLQQFFNDCFPDWAKRTLTDKKAKA